MELLLALAVVAIAVLAVVAVQSMLARRSTKTATRQNAVACASALLDVYETQLSGDIESSVSTGPEAVPTEYQFGSRPFTMQVEDIFLGDPDDGLKSLSVTVTWDDSTGSQNVTLATKVCRAP